MKGGSQLEVGCTCSNTTGYIDRALVFRLLFIVNFSSRCMYGGGSLIMCTKFTPQSNPKPIKPVEKATKLSE